MTKNLLNKINYYKNLMLFQITLLGIIIFILLKILIIINNNTAKIQAKNSNLKIGLKEIIRRESYLNDFNDTLLKDINQKIKDYSSSSNYKFLGMSEYKEKIYNIQKENNLTNPIKFNISPSFTVKENICNDIIDHFSTIKQNVKFVYYTNTIRESLHLIDELFQTMPKYSIIDSIILKYNTFRQNDDSNEYELTKFYNKVKMSTNINLYNYKY